jgi:hypothetical protein
MVDKLESELQAAASIKRKANETEQAYLQRLAEAVRELPDDEWDQISEEGQTWTNDAIKALNAEHEIESFGNGEPKEEPKEEPDDKPGEEHDDDDDNGESKEGGEEVEEKAAKPARRVAAKKEAAPKKKAVKEAKPAKKTVVKTNGSRPAGAQTMIKQLLLKDPSMSTEDILAQLSKKGYSPTRQAATSIRSGFRHSLKVIKEAGMLSPKVDI